MITGRPANARGASSERSRTVMTGIAVAMCGRASPAAAAAPAPRKSRRETDITSPILGTATKIPRQQANCHPGERSDEYTGPFALLRVLTGRKKNSTNDEGAEGMIREHT